MFGVALGVAYGAFYRTLCACVLSVIQPYGYNKLYSYVIFISVYLILKMRRVYIPHVLSVRKINIFI